MLSYDLGFASDSRSLRSEHCSSAQLAEQCSARGDPTPALLLRALDLAVVEKVVCLAGSAVNRLVPLTSKSVIGPSLSPKDDGLFFLLFVTGMTMGETAAGNSFCGLMLPELSHF